MADPSGLAKIAYINNLLLVKALIPTKSPDVRRRAKHWTEVLALETTTGEELATRNEYLWYLLLNLQYGEMNSPPFDTHPPPGRLKPLSLVVDAETYQKILNGVKNEIYFRDTFEHITEDKLKKTMGRQDDTFSFSYGIPWTEAKSAQKAQKSGQKSARSSEHTGVNVAKMSSSRQQGDYSPMEFLNNQPRPNLGAICYGAVFSDYGKDGLNGKMRAD